MFGFPSDVFGLAAYTRRTGLTRKPRNFESAILISRHCDSVIFAADRILVDSTPIINRGHEAPCPPGQPVRTPPESLIATGSRLTGLRARARCTALRKLCPSRPPGPPPTNILCPVSANKGCAVQVFKLVPATTRPSINANRGQDYLIPRKKSLPLLGEILHNAQLCDSGRARECPSATTSRKARNGCYEKRLLSRNSVKRTRYRYREADPIRCDRSPADRLAHSDPAHDDLACFSKNGSRKRSLAEGLSPRANLALQTAFWRNPTTHRVFPAMQP